MRKSFGFLLVLISAIAIWIFCLDIKRNELFAREGIKTQASVIGIEFLDPYFTLQQNTQAYPGKAVAFDYSYKVSGKIYTNHVTHNFYFKSMQELGYIGYAGRRFYGYPLQPDLHKGDTISIEYLAGNPAISRYVGDVVSTELNRLLIGIFTGLAIIGIVLGIWPDKKKPKKKKKIDWNEYERTHE